MEDDNITLNNEDQDNNNNTESNRVPPQESLNRNIDVFTAGFDCSISGLQEQVNELKEITEKMEKTHRDTTIGSLSGGVFGVAGGIMVIAGLALTPSTLGGSLVLTGLGIGVATGGGVTGAASNITDRFKQKKSRKKLKTILKSIEKKLNPLLQHVRDIELSLEEIGRDQSTIPSVGRVQTGSGVIRGLGYSVETIRLINFVKFGAVVSRTVEAAAAITGILAGLLLMLDVVYIVKDTKKLINIDEYRRGGAATSHTLKFIQAMKETVDHLNQILDELRKVREVTN